MTISPLDSRLTLRVLQVWKELSKGGLPKRSQIEPKKFNPDWANCLIIDLDPEAPRSHFSYIGTALQDLTVVTSAKRSRSDSSKGWLFKLLAPQIVQVMTNKLPVKFAGLARNNDKDILYRTVLMPLSEVGDEVDGILVGISYREVSVEKALPVA